MSDHTVNKRSDIPDAPYYVLSNDPFMSGWGDAANKINTVVLPCADYKEAMFVESMSHKRGDQKRIRITSRKPTMKSHVCYSLYQRHDAEAWYTLAFVVCRANNPKDGFKLDCPEIREMRRECPYNVHISNAERYLHSLSTTLPTLADVLTYCAMVAESVGCRSITINPL